MSRLMESLARLFALAGGLVLSFLILMTCASIAGRLINSILHSDAVQAIAPGLAATLLATGVGPINGDFELVEAGMAFAIFAFLPLCQLHAGHAKVDIFTQTLSDQVNRLLRAGIEVVFAGVMVLIAVQLYGGMMSKMRSGQTSFLIEFPVWWGYAASLSAATVAALVAVYVAGMRVAEAVQGRTLLTGGSEASH